MSILLVEDELLWQQTLTKVLEYVGCNVVIAGSYEEAKAYLTSVEATSNFELVLLDLALEEWSDSLQGMDLLPFFDKFSKQNQIKVIILTDQNTHRNTIEAARRALFDYTDVVFSTYEKNQLGDAKEFITLVQDARGIESTKEDWWKSAEIGAFYGRHEELYKLEHWILTENCRLVMLLGMGGIGKSSLTLKLVEQIGAQFDYIFGRDLRNAPPFEEVIGDAIKFLSNQQESESPGSVDEALSVLIGYLQEFRCLIVLDNLEAILQRAGQPGQYREEFEVYRHLIRQVGETEHQSCLVVTSREKPEGIESLEVTSVTNVLELEGLKLTDGRDVLKEKGLFGTDEMWMALVTRYSGNPLALKLVASTIQEVLDGDIGSFLRYESSVFGGVRDVLDQQFVRLSKRELDVIYWLAIEREAITLDVLLEDFAQPSTKQELSTALKSLQDRSLIEYNGSRYFTLQPVILEYITGKLIEHICREIRTEEFALFMSHALIQAQAKDYIRNSQIRFILQPIASNLVVDLGKAAVENKLKSNLSKLRELRLHRETGYAGGNILNLLIHCQTDLKSYDFSGLTIWQANLQDVNLSNVNFSYADLTKSSFTQVFGGILSVALDSNRSMLIAGATSGKIHTWQIPNGKHLYSSQGHIGWIRAIVCNPSLDMFASGGHDHTVRLWNSNTGECIKILKGHSNQVWSLSFSHDGALLASAGEDQTIRVWDVATGQCIVILRGHTGGIWSTAFSYSGYMLASGSEDQSIRLWDVFKGQQIGTLVGHRNRVRSIVFNPTFDMLASGGDDQTIRLWNIETGQCVKALLGHKGHIRSLAFDSTGDLLASAGDDRVVRLWDLKTEKCIKTLAKHTSRVRSIIIDSTNNLLASGGDDQVINLWDIGRGKCIKSLKGYTYEVWTVSFSPDGTLIASAGEDQVIRLWDTNTGQCIKILSGHTNRIWAVTFSSDGEVLASGSDDRTVRLWDVHTGQCLRILRNTVGQVRSVAQNDSYNDLIAVADDRNVWLWNFSSGLTETLEKHTNRVWSVAFSHDGKILASGGEDKNIWLYGVSGNQYLKRLQGHHNRVLSIAFDHADAILATAGDDRTIKLWDISSGQCIRDLQGHNGRIWSVMFSPTDTLLASAGEDGNIMLWDISLGKCIRTLQSSSSVHSIAFSPCGRMLSSGGVEAIDIWDIETGSRIKTLKIQKPYEHMNITGAFGLTKSQKNALKSLGAVETLA